jgi:guanine nucleotide-binding protein subunit alpha
MGICHSSEKDDPERKRSSEIDRYLEKEKIVREKQCKVLLLGKRKERKYRWSGAVMLRITLGSGESGKSTILKQMKIINMNGYSTEELFTYRSIIYRNVVECAQTLIHAMAKLELSYEKRELRVKKRLPRKNRIDYSCTLYLGKC